MDNAYLDDSFRKHGSDRVWKAFEAIDNRGYDVVSPLAFEAKVA